MKQRYFISKNITFVQKKKKEKKRIPRVYFTIYSFHNSNEIRNNALCFDSPSFHSVTFAPEALDQVISYLVRGHF